MLWPTSAAALSWLQTQGINSDAAATLLRASGARPEDVLQFMASGRDPASWAALPRAMQRGDISILKEWTPVQTIDALQKLCHDLMAQKAGAAPRFFEPAQLSLPAVAPSMAALGRWSKDLAAATRTMDHPFNAGLMMEALVSQAKNTLNQKHVESRTP